MVTPDHPQHKPKTCQSMELTPFARHYREDSTTGSVGAVIPGAVVPVKTRPRAGARNPSSPHAPWIPAPYHIDTPYRVRGRLCAGMTSGRGGSRTAPTSSHAGDRCITPSFRLSPESRDAFTARDHMMSIHVTPSQPSSSRRKGFRKGLTRGTSPRATQDRWPVGQWSDKARCTP